MRLILSQACDLLSEYVENGMCSTDPRVIRGINLAIERLLPRLNPDKTIARYQFDVVDNTITMPREIKTVMAASTQYESCAGGKCGPGCRSILSVKSRWYEMLSGGPVGFIPCAQNILMDLGTGFSTFADPSADTPLTLRLYADIPQPSDEGFLVVTGVDSDGNDLVDYVNGVYVPGKTIEIPQQGTQYIDTPMMVAQIISITKPKTQGRLRLFGVDALGNQVPLAVYDPDELNPDYRRYMITWVGDGTPQILTVLAKRRYIMTTSPYADLLITNVGALQNALLAMKFEKAGVLDQAVAHWKIAFDILDTETRDFDGDYSTVPQLQTQFAGGDIWSMR